MNVVKSNKIFGKYELLSSVNFKWLLLAAIALVLVDVLCFNNLLELNAEEPRRAIVSFEILESGEWIVPHIHSEVYYNKPPVFNWIQAAFMSVFGYSEWVARLPGALSFLLTGGVVFIVMKRIVSENLALLGAFAFLSSADLLFYGSVNAGEIDLFYMLLTVVQFFVIYYYRKKEQFLQLFLLSYLLTAIGFLTKGIPSLAFQAISLLAYFTFTKKFWKLFSWQHLMGVLLLTLIVGGYLWQYNQSADAVGFLVRQFKETSQRSANEFGVLDIIGSLVAFPGMLFGKLMPWTLLFPLYFYKPVRKFVWENDLLKFVVIIFISNILIYWTAPDVRARYVYMFFPLLIILLVSPLSVVKWEEVKLRKFFTIPSGIGVALIGVGMFVLVFVLDLNWLQILVAVLLGVLGVGAGLVFWTNYRNANVLWIVVLSLLLGRLAYNALVLPQKEKFDNELVYRGVVAEMCEKVDGRIIYLTGKREAIHSNVSLFGKEYYDDTLFIPPTIPYQLPYYYAKYTKNVLKYVEQPVDSLGYYLTYKTPYVNYEEIDVLFEFKAMNSDNYFILYALKR